MMAGARFLGSHALLLFPLSLPLVLRPVSGLQSHHAGLANLGIAGVEGIQGVRFYHSGKFDLLSAFPDLIALAIFPELASLPVGGMHDDRVG